MAYAAIPQRASGGGGGALRRGRGPAARRRRDRACAHPRSSVLSAVLALSALPIAAPSGSRLNLEAPVGEGGRRGQTGGRGRGAACRGARERIGSRADSVQRVTPSRATRRGNTPGTRRRRRRRARARRGGAAARAFARAHPRKRSVRQSLALSAPKMAAPAALPSLFVLRPCGRAGQGTAGGSRGGRWRWRLAAPGGGERRGAARRRLARMRVPRAPQVERLQRAVGLECGADRGTAILCQTVIAAAHAAAGAGGRGRDAARRRPARERSPARTAGRGTSARGAS